MKRWARPRFTASGGRAWLDLVVLTREKPSLDVDLDDEDGYPDDYALPRSIHVRTAALAEHRQAFASTLEGPFRELANAQIGEAARAIDDARWAVTIEGSLADPSDLAHLQAVRAFMRFLVRTAGAVAVANDLALAWQAAEPFAAPPPPAELRLDEWIEVLYDDEARGLCTRGMAQFARPELAIFDQPEERLERASQLLRHLAQLQAEGGELGPDEARVEVGGVDPTAKKRVTIALAAIDEAGAEALAVTPDTRVVRGWPLGRG